MHNQSYSGLDALETKCEKKAKNRGMEARCYIALKTNRIQHVQEEHLADIHMGQG